MIVLTENILKGSKLNVSSFVLKVKPHFEIIVPIIPIIPFAIIQQSSVIFPNLLRRRKPSAN